MDILIIEELPPSFPSPGPVTSKLEFLSPLTASLWRSFFFEGHEKLEKLIQEFNSCVKEAGMQHRAVYVQCRTYLYRGSHPSSCYCR
jgi:hypothetical protein